MRKQLKRKARSCALCKPYKVGWANRWRPQERQLIKQADAEIRAAEATAGANRS